MEPLTFNKWDDDGEVPIPTELDIMPPIILKYVCEALLIVKYLLIRLMPFSVKLLEIILEVE